MSTLNQECPKIRQHLALYAGRDLEEPLCAQVEQHLAGCSACREEFGRTSAARERIRVFGVQTARDLESVELWPLVRESWTREREALETEVAALNLSRPRSTLRRWLPLSLAAAAALVIALGWAMSPDQLLNSGEGVNPPGVHAPKLADNSGPMLPAQAVSTGSLRRAGPGEERLRDSSAPLFMPMRSLQDRAGTDSTNSLVGDDGLR
jgi:anti-sigma factor RsiW